MSSAAAAGGGPWLPAGPCLLVWRWLPALLLALPPQSAHCMPLPALLAYLPGFGHNCSELVRSRGSSGSRGGHGAWPAFSGDVVPELAELAWLEELAVEGHRMPSAGMLPMQWGMSGAFPSLRR